MTRFLILLGTLCLAPAAFGEWATNSPFTIPLANQEKASGLFLDQTTLLVAKPGQPPVLDLYRVTPSDSPQPQPGPGPNPKPEPHPKPTPTGPISLYWIEETEDRTPDQAAALTDKTLREALAKARWTLRVVDDDVVDEEGNPPPELAPYIQAARTRGLPTIFAVDTAGAEIYAGKAPANAAEFRQLLGRLGLPLTKPTPPAPQQPPPETATETPPIPKTTNPADCPTGTCPVNRVPTIRWRVFR